MKDQKEFFQMIVSRFANRSEAARAIADLTFVEPKTVMRWIRDEVPIRYETFRLLVSAFDMPVQDLVSRGHDIVHFRYTNLDVEAPDNYLRYIGRMAAMLEDLVNDPAASIHFVADEVPIFHFMPFEQLTYFKLFAYCHDVLKPDITYEAFCADMVSPDLTAIFHRIDRAYATCDSVEIWGTTVLDDILYHIRYIWDVGLFASMSSAQLLLDQLSALLDRFATYLKRGQKDGGGKLDFYLSEILNRSGYMIVHRQAGTQLHIKLHTINSLATDYPPIISEAGKWYSSAIDKSLNLGVGAARERNLYFKRLHDRIEVCRRYITKGSGKTKQKLQAQS